MQCPARRLGQLEPALPVPVRTQAGRHHPSQFQLPVPVHSKLKDQSKLLKSGHWQVLMHNYTGLFS